MIKDHYIRFVNKNECTCMHDGQIKTLCASADTIVEKTGALRAVCTGNIIEAVGCLKTPQIHYILAKTGDTFTYFKEQIESAKVDSNKREANIIIVGPYTLGN